MARLRQYYPNRYASSEAAQAEFESIIRYINAAELGNLSLSELFKKLFDDDGNVDFDINFRFDPSNGLQSAVGIDAPWKTITSAESLRGAPGVSLGTIESPIMFNRRDFEATAAQQTFPYVINSEAADLLVFINGVLQARDSYTWSQTASTVTLGAGQTAGTKVTIYSIRDNSASTYRRADFTSGSNQSLFPFPHEEEEEIIVYRNGVLQRAGASYDFISSAATGTITMTTPQGVNTLISILVVNNKAVRDVLGVMLEDRYATDGLIRLDRIGFPDNGLPQAKVQGLVAALGSKPTLAVQGTTPDPTLTRLWVNTSPAVPRLLFSDGARWLDPSPQGLLPLPQAGDVLKFLRLNSTATALEYAPLDFSALVQATAVGNPSGVASLDSQGQVPVQQVPAIHRRAHFTGKVAGAVSNGTIPVGLLSGNNFSIESASFKLGAGTATVQLFIAGSAVGTAIAVGTAVVKNPWSAVTQNAAAAGLEMALVVTSAAGATDLLWAVNGAVLS